jgi:hypothetical protein
MKYSGDVQVGGKLAGVGQRLIDTVSKGIISQAFETLDRVLEERNSAEAEGREAVYEGASQKDYAAAVARGMLSAPWVKWTLAVLIIVLIGVIAVLILN